MYHAGLYPYGIDVGDLRQQVLTARKALLEDEQPDWHPHLTHVEAMSIAFELRLAEPSVTVLLRRLDQAWLERSFCIEQQIDHLSEEEANWRLKEGEPSSRELRKHLGSRKAVIKHRCFDHITSDDELFSDQYIKLSDIQVPSSWHKFLSWLTEQHETLRKAVAFLQDQQLSKSSSIFGKIISLKQIIERKSENDFYDAREINRIREIYEKMSSKNNPEGQMSYSFKSRVSSDKPISFASKL